jgi:alcohol dehydrogenase class IV
LRKLGLCDPALASLGTTGAAVTVFDEVEADPSLATVMKAVEAGRMASATGVIGFGGGSSLDVAKVAALLLGSGEDIEGAWGVGNAKGPRLPLALVPTTAGTGSEVTRYRSSPWRERRSAACRHRSSFRTLPSSILS